VGTTPGSWVRQEIPHSAIASEHAAVSELGQGGRHRHGTRGPWPSGITLARPTERLLCTFEEPSGSGRNVRLVTNILPGTEAFYLEARTAGSEMGWIIEAHSAVASGRDLSERTRP
jgi:hypothetical protein